MSISNLRTCKKGHKYYRSSDCPVCPVCEKELKPSAGFLAVVGSPARRALEREGIDTFAKLAKYTEEELLKLHGVGPSTIPNLKKTLKAEGLSFRKK